jgi:hypothetical protein
MATDTEPVAETTYGGTFIFASICRPWAACSNDETRPVLCHPYLRRRNDGLWLLASDSYIAAAIKVNEGTEGTVQDGFVPRKVAKLIRRGCEATQLSPTAWKVIVEPGYHEATYDVAGLGIGTESKFPDLESIGLWDGPKAGAPFDDDIRLKFDPALTQRLNVALGGMYGRGIEARFYGPLTAIHYQGPFGDAFGLQMPMQMKG